MSPGKAQVRESVCAQPSHFPSRHLLPPAACRLGVVTEGAPLPKGERRTQTQQVGTLSCQNEALSHVTQGPKLAKRTPPKGQSCPLPLAPWLPGATRSLLRPFPVALGCSPTLRGVCVCVCLQFPRAHLCCLHPDSPERHSLLRWLSVIWETPVSCCCASPGRGAAATTIRVDPSLWDGGLRAPAPLLDDVALPYWSPRPLWLWDDGGQFPAMWRPVGLQPYSA